MCWSCHWITSLLRRVRRAHRLNGVLFCVSRPYQNSFTWRIQGVELLPSWLMQRHVINAIATVLAWLPLRANHAIGGTVGWLAWITKSRLRTITLINLQLCFPDWSDEEKQRVGKVSLIETGKALTESFWLWRRPIADITPLLHFNDSQQLLENARASSQGLIVATPHLGCWELCCLPLAQENKVSCLYLPPKMAALEPVLLNGRDHLGVHSTPLDAGGIKHILKELKQGRTIGLLPDQEPDEKNGIFAPLFQQPANTMTLMSKFASRTNASVLFCFAVRLPKAKGWEYHYIDPVDGIDSADKTIATVSLNQTIEHCIHSQPEQYLWNYKRFRRQQDGTRRNYREAV